MGYVVAKSAVIGGTQAVCCMLAAGRGKIRLTPYQGGCSNKDATRRGVSFDLADLKYANVLLIYRTTNPHLQICPYSAYIDTKRLSFSVLRAVLLTSTCASRLSPWPLASGSQTIFIADARRHTVENWDGRLESTRYFIMEIKITKKESRRGDRKENKTVDMPQLDIVRSLLGLTLSLLILFSSRVNLFTALLDSRPGYEGLRRNGILECLFWLYFAFLNPRSSCPSFRLSGPGSTD